MRLSVFLRLLITGLVLSAAILLAVLLWRHYMYSPWTRDGRVMADVVTIASDVSGLVVEVPVADNQRVKKGDLLMRIDPERYRFALDQAKAREAVATSEAGRLRDEAMRRAKVGTDVLSSEGHELAEAAYSTAQARLDEARANRALAELNLARTEVRSPVNGFVTNLSVYSGDYANAGTPRMALIDESSFWICAYFEETKLPHVRPGDKAMIEMLDGSPVFAGEVEGIAKGIGERDNPTGAKLLVDVNPTYNWVRLAQRIPVRVKVNPADAQRLSMGMTCTVVVREQKP